MKGFHLLETLADTRILCQRQGGKLIPIFKEAITWCSCKFNEKFHSIDFIEWQGLTLIWQMDWGGKSK